MKKLFRDLKTSILSIIAFILLAAGSVFLFNLFPMNNYVSYLISLAFYITSAMILFYNVEKAPAEEDGY